MEDDLQEFSQVLVPVPLNCGKKWPFLPTGRQMGIISRSLDPNHGYVQLLGSKMLIPYYFPAGQGNKFNLQPQDEIEFDLVPYYRGQMLRYEATQIEPLEAGSLRYEFNDNMYNAERAGLDRESGVLSKMPNEDEPGVIEWQPNQYRACFYPKFQLSDIVEIPRIGGEKLRLTVGDRVKFYHARERNGKDVEQRLAKFIVPARCPRFQGEVCSIKSGYGFIKRLDKPLETFFHASQVIYTGGDKEQKRIEVGDKIDFSLGTHDGKEVALHISILPRSFPIVFDDQATDPFGNLVEFKGRVVKPCVKGELDKPGIIKYNMYGGDRMEEIELLDEIEYYERDRQNSFTILKDDDVIFHIATDRRSLRERAVNIRMQEDAIRDDRERGVVAAVKDGFGFIKRDKNSRRDHHDSRMFFHSSELLDKFAISGRRRIKMGDQVEFTVLRDPLAKHTQQGRYHATRIKIISPRSIRHENHNREKGSKWNRSKKYSKAEQFDELFEPEVIDLEPKSEDYLASLRNDVEGVIEKLPTDEPPGSTRTVSTAAKKKLLGLLESPVMRSPEKHMGSGEGPMGPMELIHASARGSEGVKSANVPSSQRYTGRVKLIKENENYGFVIRENENEDLFFHFSDAANFDQLRKDDRVEFSIRDNDRSGKRNAYDVAILERKKLPNRALRANCLRSPKPGFSDRRGFKPRT